MGLALLATGARLIPRHPERNAASLIDPRVVHERDFVGSDVCRSCHPYQHLAWQSSFHHTMTQVASSQAILAPFDGTQLRLEGVTWRVERRADEFWVVGNEKVPTRADSLRFERRIVMTTGSHNYQLFWMESDGATAMQPFPLVYVLYERLWIPRKSRFLVPPVERTPVEAGRWSIQCIKCHATGGQPQHIPTGETRVAELGISCEACHGPGGEHARANHNPLRRFRYYGSDQHDPTIVNPAHLPHDRATQVCGQCHSIEIFLTPERADDWLREGLRYRPGDELEEFQTIVDGRYEDNPPEVRHYLDNHPVFHLRNCFWPDGTIRVTGREYHGMLESPCYQRGEMSCLSCHRLHRARDDARAFSEWAADQLNTDMNGDDACLQCHARYAGTDAMSAHSHHPAGSTGSRCYNCHMPYTTWGLLRAIRSHTVDSPSVATSVKSGRPNACNQCHLDQSLQWTAKKLEQWYGIEPPDLSEDERTIAASILWTLSGDAVQRALMAWSMGWGPAREISGTQWMVPYLAALLVDPYDAIRFNAQRSLRQFAEYHAVASDSVVGATKDKQLDIMRSVLNDWNHKIPLQGTEGLSRLLILHSGQVDKAPFTRLVALRNEQELILFE